MRQVVILGAGPVGLTMANKLSKQLNVLVISPSNPLKFSSTPDSDFFLQPSSESGTLFGNSVYWGSQHESLNIPSAPAPEFSDLPGFPFALTDLNEWGEELLTQGWPHLTKVSNDRQLEFDSLKRTFIFKGKSLSPLPGAIQSGVTVIQSDFKTLSFNFRSDLSVESIEIDSVVYPADYFVLALGGLSNVALLQQVRESLQGLGDAKLNMLGKGYSNHPKTAVAQLYFSKITRLNRGNFFLRHKSRANYELDLSRSSGRALRVNARLWPDFSHSSFLKSFYLRLLGQLGYFKQAKIIVYFELPQLSSNSVKLILKDDLNLHFKFEYQFPMEMKTQLLGQLEMLINSFMADKKVKDVKKIPFDFNHVLYHDSNHHFGGTRMAESCTDGVVDGVGRTFLSANLFVVGTSTLPVSSSLHPTLLCAALSLRTAAEIAKL